MQFLPVNTQLDNFFSRPRENEFRMRDDHSASDFARLMQSGEESVQDAGSLAYERAGDAVSEAEDLFSGAKSLEDYSREVSGEESPGDFLQGEVSEEDFAALEEKLQNQGVSKEVISELEEKVAGGELSWDELLSRLEDITGRELEVELSAGDERRIQVFLQKLGFSTDESRNILEQLKSGNLEEALSRIMARLQEMSPDKFVPVSEKEFQALSRAFGLKDSPFDFPYAKGDELNKEQLRHLLSSLKQAHQEAGDSELMKGLKDLRQGDITAKELLDKLAQSKGKDKESALEAAFRLALKAKKEGGDFETAEDKKRFYQAMANQKKDENAKGFLGTNSKSGGGETNNNSGANAKKASDAGETGKMSVREKFLQSEGENKGNSGKGEASANAERNASTASARNSENGNEGQQKDSKDNAKSWKELLNKLNSSDEGGAKEKTDAKSVFFQRAGLNDVLGSKEIKNPATGQRVPTSRIMDQIQQGIFKNLGQGRSQMTLQLNPPQLGSISLMLHVHNNEVHATIKTMSSDITHAVQENMAQLKSSLEQQGLKVSRMDVQTQLRDDSHLQDGNWQGADQHNEARERLRRGGRMGILRELGEDGEEVVRELQMTRYGENISQSGLDMFA
jgi:flagellar hook-length control protein FliK